MTNHEETLLSWALVTDNGVIPEAVGGKELSNILKAIKDLEEEADDVVQ